MNGLDFLICRRFVGLRLMDELLGYGPVDF
jgi:hypothetical protein